MDIRKVKKLIEMLESSNLEEIEIQEGEESVRLVKNKSVTSLTNAPFIASEVQTQEITEHEVITGNQIKSPMVGTFYSSPSPGAKPFS